MDCTELDYLTEKERKHYNYSRPLKSEEKYFENNKGVNEVGGDFHECLHPRKKGNFAWFQISYNKKKTDRSKGRGSFGWK